MAYPVAVNELYRQTAGTQLRQSQEIAWVAYDTEQYTSAATVELNFFRTVKTSKVLSNMSLAGCLPHPESMRVYSIGILPKKEPGALETSAPNTLTDFYRLLFQSYVTFTCGHKDYLLAPSFCFPAGVGIDAAIGGAGGEAADEFVINANHGIPSPVHRWWFQYPHMIEPMQKFEFTMKWDAAQTLTGNLYVTVLLFGPLVRPVQ